MRAEWIKTAKVGDKVVCLFEVDEMYIGEVGPEPGCVYTIRELCVFGGDVYFLLVEIVNEKDIYDCFDEFMLCEPSFSWECFEPVVDRHTDITIFTDMLKPVSNPVHEEA